MIKILSIIFAFALLWIIFKFVKLAIKMTWSFTKIVFTIVLFPLGLVWMAFSGMLMFSIVLIVLAGAVTFAN